MNPGNKILYLTVDGCDYKVEVAPSEEVLWVYTANGEKVADAEKDSAVESVYFGYFDVDGLIDTSSATSLYEQPPLKIAEWLIATHPCN